MTRLTRRDFTSLNECTRDLYAHLDVQTLSRHILAVLRRVVPAEYVSYNEVDLHTSRAMVAVELSTVSFLPEEEHTFASYLHEHPLIDYHRRTRDGWAVKLSDFLTPDQFHRLALYNEVYRRRRVEFQMAITLPAPASLVIGIAFNRSQRDFSERDRCCLNVLRPHLHQVTENAAAFTQVQQDTARLRQELEALGSGVIVLESCGRARILTEQIRQWLTAYFGGPPRQTGTLPEALQCWVRQQQALLAQDDGVPSPRVPLVVERQGKRLSVRLVTDTAGQYSLVLQEQRTARSASALQALGLSQRQAEVLFWVAQGKTNAEIGTILHLSNHTVRKHLERIYPKLGVENRIAATHRALEVLGLPDA